MTENSGDIINAANRFEIRSDLAEFGTGEDEYRLVRDTLVEQPARFAGFLTEFNPRLRELLEPFVSQGMPTSVTETHREEGEPPVQDEDYRVCYHHEKGHLKPHLHLSPAAVKEVAGLLDPFFAGKIDERLARRQLLETSTVTVAWMALGKWAFGEIDLRHDGKSLEDEAAEELLRHISYLNNEDLSKLNSEQAEAKIRASLEIFQNRLMGMFAYQGLQKQLDAYKEEMRPDKAFLPFIRTMCREIYRAAIGNNNMSIIKYALAEPLTVEQAQSTVDLLIEISKNRSA